MKTLGVIVVLFVIAIAISALLLEKRPGYGPYYGLAKLSGARLDFGPVNWATLTRRSTPNDALVCPADRCPQAKPDREPRVYPIEPAALLARLSEVALAESRTYELYCGPDCEQRVRFVQYSRIIHYPDTIDVLVFPVTGGSSLAIYSRSLLGRGDFGVNRARIERWLAALDAS
jgi:uncharacterized protein (DUF1499 family)